MRVTCEQCNAGYTLPKRKLKPGRSVQFDCRHCGHRIVVRVPLEAEPAVKATVWFVAQAQGSYAKQTEAEVRAAIGSGSLKGSTLVWSKGQKEWTPVSDTEMWRQERTLAQAKPSQPIEAEASGPAPESAAPTAELDTPAGAPAETQIANASGVQPTNAASPSSIVGAGESSADQRAVSMPIVRVREGAEDNDRQQAPRGAAHERAVRADSPSSPSNSHGAGQPHERFAPGARPTGTPVDTGDPNTALNGDSAVWSPATDTYIGPRNPHTFRIGSEQERQSLVAHVELEQALRTQIRRWQMVTVAATLVATLAIALAVYGWVSMRSAKAEAVACQKDAER